MVLFPFYIVFLFAGATNAYYCLKPDGTPLSHKYTTTKNNYFAITVILLTYLYRLLVTVAYFFNTNEFVQPKAPLTFVFKIFIVVHIGCLAMVFRRNSLVLQIQKSLNFIIVLLPPVLISLLLYRDLGSFISYTVFQLPFNILFSIPCFIALYSATAKDYYNATNDFWGTPPENQ